MRLATIKNREAAAQGKRAGGPGVKVQVYKKAFNNIDKDEKSQTKAYKMYKAMSMKNLKLDQKRGDAGQEGMPVSAFNNNLGPASRLLPPPSPNLNYPGTPSHHVPASKPPFQRNYQTILMQKSRGRLEDLFSNEFVRQNKEPSKMQKTQSAMHSPMLLKASHSVKHSVGFETKAKRFKEEMDHIFERRYAGPGPGHYEPGTRGVGEQTPHELWKKH